MYTYMYMQICVMCLCVLLVSFLLNLITFPQTNTWHIKTSPLVPTHILLSLVMLEFHSFFAHPSHPNINLNFFVKIDLYFIRNILYSFAYL